MAAKFTVFGNCIDKGQSALVYFDRNGHVVPTSSGAIALVEFAIDEDNDPVGYVREGIEHFDHQLLYFGGFDDPRYNRANVSFLDGRAVLVLRREQTSFGNHFIVERAEMKLWLLTAEGPIGECAIASLVVRAANEQTARQLAAEKSQEDRGHDYRDDPTTECYLGKDCWLDPTRTSATEIAAGGEAVLHINRL